MGEKMKTKEAVLATGLGKRYGSFWALKNCSVTIPHGSVCALVGPNGAGKTTLLKLLSGLSSPSEGQAVVLGNTPLHAAEYVSDIGYLAQEIPLYKQLTADQHFALGAHLNKSWDNELALRRLRELHIPLDKRIGKLSGGQCAQVGLAMALAKKPKLLLLDEPVAALDPLARVDFLTSLTQAVADAEGELTVVMSSHLLADLERVCDHIIILAAGETQLCDGIEHTLETHRVFVGARGAKTTDPAFTVIKESHSASQTNLLVRLNDMKYRSQEWHIREADIEEIVLGYMGQQRETTTEAKR
jgi:ABC-2 type transport system ATP-binding protein